jgi:hypothetical protein
MIANTSGGTLTVVAYSNALFHPKTCHVTRADGTKAAVVGSSNVTPRGLGLNVEASVVLDEADGDDPILIQQIATAVDVWQSANCIGAFKVTSLADIDQLVDGRVVDIEQPAPPSQVARGNSANSASSTQLAVRSPAWSPAKERKSASGRITPVGGPALKSRLGRRTSRHVLPALRWCKLLKPSDAQQVKTGTNTTGKLRLTQARHNIDHETFFRNDFFSNSVWAESLRNGNSMQSAIITFDVVVRGMSLGAIPLIVDYGMHRISSQSNVPTVLSWGPLEKLLISTSHVGDWISIERTTSGQFRLEITRSRPPWAP